MATVIRGGRRGPGRSRAPRRLLDQHRLDGDARHERRILFASIRHARRFLACYAAGPA